MSERDQLREALIHQHVAAFGLTLAGAAGRADAVLAVLDQQGWPDEVTQGDCAEGEDDSRTGLIARLRTAEAERDAALRALAEADNHHNAGACPYCTHNGEFVLVKASELAALREAARYEQVGFATVPRDLHTHSAQHQERWIDHGCVPLYRQVTEGEEG